MRQSAEILGMIRICAITGSRADYGPMRPLLKAMREAEDFELDVVAVEPHWRAGTVEEIRADGFTPQTDRLFCGPPDAAIVLGDRSEILWAAADVYNKNPAPLIHLYGGERTDGSRDDARRHAITKLADLHFVAAEPYRERVIQLGEDPARVFTVGALAVDTAMTVPKDAAGENQYWGRRPAILATYHPCGEPVDEMLAALDNFPDYAIALTGPNSDPGGPGIELAMRVWVKERVGRAHFTPSLGQHMYLLNLAKAAVVVGNSSSALIEAPALGTPAVNIGARQQGRLMAASVLSCGNTREAITAAIRAATSPAFGASIIGQHLPYGGGGVAQKIMDVLRATDFSALGIKRFRDL
jgi:UDP-hydrolysing UDP-N-acetyl-D-glucosamine 2-epimerase